MNLLSYSPCSPYISEHEETMLNNETTLWLEAEYNSNEMKEKHGMK